jgi:hypothetical protein
VSKLNKSAAESLSAAARCVPIAGFASAARKFSSGVPRAAQFDLGAHYVALILWL